MCTCFISVVHHSFEILLSYFPKDGKRVLDARRCLSVIYSVFIFSSPLAVWAAELLGRELHLLLHGSDSLLLPVTCLQPSVHHWSLCILLHSVTESCKRTQPPGHDYFFLPCLPHCVVSLTYLRCVAGCVSGQGSKHLPFVLPAEPGPQEQDRIQLPACHDVCRYGVCMRWRQFKGSSV